MGYTHIERIDVTTKSINNVFVKKQSFFCNRLVDKT